MSQKVNHKEIRKIFEPHDKNTTHENLWHEIK